MQRDEFSPPASQISRTLISALAFVLAAPFFFALTACQKEPVDLELLAEYSFQDFTADETVGVDLPVASGQALLVRVEGLEADFESSMLDERGEFLSTARLPYVRAGPVFHVIDRMAESEPARLVVRPLQFTKNARISVTVSALPADSRRDLARIEAYRAYETATQSTEDESPELWRERAELLQTAAAGFKRSGVLEAGLWAEYLQAYALYFPLAEFDRAVNIAWTVQERARKHDHFLVELMATQLESQALFERAEGDPPEVAQQKGTLALEVARRAADLAAGEGYEFEQAWALNSLGSGLFYLDRFAEAVQAFERALDIALELQDEDFEIQVRSNLAITRERGGDLGGALAVLQQINTRLQESGSTADLAHNWSELGRLYETLYLFPEAIHAQNRAMQLWQELNSAEGIGLSGLSLAHSYQAIGNPQAAVEILAEAIDDMHRAGFARGLRNGYGLLADLHRGQQQFERMDEARQLQADYLTSDRHRAHYRYEQGLDLLAYGGNDPAQAESFFAEAEALAEAVGDKGLQLRARLQRCVLGINVPDICSGEALETSLLDWLPAAPPSQAFEARFLFVRVMAAAGALAEAWDTVEALIDDFEFYRDRLPGVLGAWYWEGRAQVFDFYMRLALDESTASPDPASRALLAFNRLLNVSLGNNAGAESESRPADEAAELEELRELLATLEGAAPQRRPEIRQAIDRRLLRLRSRAQASTGRLEETELRTLLQSLPPESALLAYYLTGKASWAWLADREEIRVISLGEGPDIEHEVERTRSGLRVVGNERLDGSLEHLGGLLLGPIEQELPENLYVLAAGKLAGFPFDAIRRNNRYLGQDHAIVNLMSLEGLRHVATPPDIAEGWQQVLLAGDPVQAGHGYSELPSASRELDGLAALLGGRSLTSVTAEHLDREFFNRQEVATADVIHIASHAQSNLAYPELSRLTISSGAGTSGFLTPLDLRGQSITADLVVLSACETTGVNAYSLDSNLGFVSAFLQSGANAVVATLWPVADGFAAEFVLDFYAQMVEGNNPPSALANAKRRYFPIATTSENLDWSAFQIYVN